MRPPDLPTFQEIGSNKPHGTRLRYLAGCRCLPCRAANAAYSVQRRRAKERGEWNGFVPADKARKHLQALSRRGIGRRFIHRMAGVSETVLYKIRSGQRKNIRKSTETRILKLSLKSVRPGLLVDAKPTWRLISQLQSEGFSKAEIARRIGGYATPSLQFKRDKIIFKTAVKVSQLYRRVMT